MYGVIQEKRGEGESALVQSGLFGCMLYKSAGWYRGGDLELCVCGEGRGRGGGGGGHSTASHSKRVPTRSHQEQKLIHVGLLCHATRK